MSITVGGVTRGRGGVIVAPAPSATPNPSSTPSNSLSTAAPAVITQNSNGTLNIPVASHQQNFTPVSGGNTFSSVNTPIPVATSAFQPQGASSRPDIGAGTLTNSVSVQQIQKFQSTGTSYSQSAGKSQGDIIKAAGNRVISSDPILSRIAEANTARTQTNSAVGAPFVAAGSSALFAAQFVDNLPSSGRVGQDVAKQSVSTSLRVLGGGLEGFGQVKTQKVGGAPGVSYGPIERTGAILAGTFGGEAVGLGIGAGLDYSAAREAAAGNLPRFLTITSTAKNALTGIGAASLVVQARYDPENVLGTSNLVLGAGFAGAAKSIGTVGLKVGDTTFDAPRSFSTKQGNFGGGIEGVPTKTLQTTTYREGVTDFSIRKTNLPFQKTTEFTSAKLLPTTDNKGLIGVGFTETATTNPISGKSIVSGEKFAIAGRGSTLAGKSNLDNVFVARTTKTTKLGFDNPETYRASYVDRATNSLPSKGGDFNYERLASVKKTIDFSQTSFTPTKQLNSNLIDISVPGSVKFTNKASSSEGFSGSYEGRLGSTDFYGKGVDLLRQEGILPKDDKFVTRSVVQNDRVPLRASKQGSLLLEPQQLEVGSRLRSSRTFTGDTTSLPGPSIKLSTSSLPLLSPVVPRIRNLVAPPSGRSSPRSSNIIPSFNIGATSLATSQKATVIPVQQFSLIPRSDVTNIPGTRQDTRSVPQQGFFNIGSPNAQTPYSPPFPGLGIPPVIGGGLGGGLKKLFSKSSKKDAYIPDFTSAAFGITSSKKQKLGGLGASERLRPLQKLNFKIRFGSKK